MAYTCDCPNCMKGGRTEPRQVSRSTYYSHAPARHQAQITPIAQYLAQQGHSVPQSGPGSNNPEASGSGPPPKRARFQDMPLTSSPTDRDNHGDGPEHHDRDGRIMDDMDRLQSSQGGTNDDENDDMDQSCDESQGSQQRSTPEIRDSENVCIIIKYKMDSLTS